MRGENGGDPPRTDTHRQGQAGSLPSAGAAGSPAGSPVRPVRPAPPAARLEALRSRRPRPAAAHGRSPPRPVFIGTRRWKGFVWK